MMEVSPNVVVKWLTLLGSNLGLENDYPEVFRGCPQSLQEHVRIVP
jgi:hypothetical protein